MEHWSPHDARADETPGPRDAWVAWLMRAPAHEVLPDRQRMNDWVGGAMMAGVAIFWAGAAALVWHAVA